MKTRQFVWTDPEIVKYVREHFITVAADDVSYNEHPREDVFERQWLVGALGGRIQQGIYVASAGGKFLGRVNRGWPDPSPSEVLKALKEAVAQHEAMGLSRKLSRRLDPTRDRLTWERDAFVKPKDTLELLVVRRGYAFQGMTSFDQRHPMYFHLDRLWFKPSEWREWLPEKLSVGSKRTVTGEARKRIVLLSHMQPGTSAWWEEHLRGGAMASEVTSVKGDLVNLRITANYDMHADSEWCKDAYRGDLLALASYDKSQERFVAFDLAMLGRHTLGRMLPNLHVGANSQMVAVTGRIAPDAGKKGAMLPQAWKYGYSLRWGRTP